MIKNILFRNRNRSTLFSANFNSQEYALTTGFAASGTTFAYAIDIEGLAGVMDKTFDQIPELLAEIAGSFPDTHYEIPHNTNTVLDKESEIYPFLDLDVPIEMFNALPGEIISYNLQKRPDFNLSRTKITDRPKPSNVDNFLTGVSESIINKSPHRVDPHCKHFGVCAGCSFSHLDPKFIPQLKTTKILQRIQKNWNSSLSSMNPNSIFPKINPLSSPKDPSILNSEIIYPFLGFEQQFPENADSFKNTVDKGVYHFSDPPSQFGYRRRGRFTFRYWDRYSTPTDDYSTPQSKKPWWEKRKQRLLNKPGKFSNVQMTEADNASYFGCNEGFFFSHIVPGFPGSSGDTQSNESPESPLPKTNFYRYWQQWGEFGFRGLINPALPIDLSGYPATWTLNPEVESNPGPKGYKGKWRGKGGNSNFSNFSNFPVDDVAAAVGTPPGKSKGAYPHLVFDDINDPEFVNLFENTDPESQQGCPNLHPLIAKYHNHLCTISQLSFAQEINGIDFIVSQVHKDDITEKHNLEAGQDVLHFIIRCKQTPSMLDLVTLSYSSQIAPIFWYFLPGEPSTLTNLSEMWPKHLSQKKHSDFEARYLPHPLFYGTNVTDNDIPDTVITVDPPIPPPWPYYSIESTFRKSPDSEENENENDTEKITTGFKFSPLGFAQINQNMNNRMISAVMESIYPFLTENNLLQKANVLDLFSGIGNFSRSISPYVNFVHGLDFEKRAMKFATQQLPPDSNIIFTPENLIPAEISPFTGDLFNTSDNAKGGKVSSLSSLEWFGLLTDPTNNQKRTFRHLNNFYPWLNKHVDGYDIILLDPPRSGALWVVSHLILGSAPFVATRCDDPINLPPASSQFWVHPQFSGNKKLMVVYVSCNPDTFARDLGLLTSFGNFKVESIRGVELFPNTSHVETIGVLTRESVAGKGEDIVFS